ncbi:hypothetical protein [Anaerophaga thermohalophila]|uniref:hypothetical protein n=1 Tax=Anaerophaga thermohalophila TaxID=177400 RepID=UPI000237D5AF|nr:hypothetical protein [Anaerophaga thermohalophila]
MKTLIYLEFSFLFLILFGCQKDPLEDIEDGSWNKERNIIDISFEGQIGDAEITRTEETAEVIFSFNMNAGIPLSDVKIKSLEISYGAEATVNTGESLNFDNENKTATIQVIPENGSPLEWTIKLDPFTELMSGSWDINDIRIIIDVMGDHPEWGGYFEEGTISDYLPESAAEYDNTFTFTFDGVDENGNSYGSFTHSSGEDGQYGEFTHNEWGYDFNYKYRLMPKDGGTWLRNPSDNSLTFIDGEGNETYAQLIEDDPEYQIRFEFSVEIYWDNPWDWVAKMEQEAKYFWYAVEKQ